MYSNLLDVSMEPLETLKPIVDLKVMQIKRSFIVPG